MVHKMPLKCGARSARTTKKQLSFSEDGHVVILYVHGTSNVAKCNVLRHCFRKAHEIAIAADQGKPADQRIASGDGIPESPSIKRQIKITTSMDKMALDSYRKLLNTAYELALNPSMPLSHFKVLVKCQHQNGVCLLVGKDDSHSCREYIHYIAAYDPRKSSCDSWFGLLHVNTVRWFSSKKSKR